MSRLVAALLAPMVAVAVMAAHAQTPVPTTPTEFDLVQVVPDWPAVHLFAVARRGNTAVPLPPDGFQAHIGDQLPPVRVAENPGRAVVLLIDVSGSLSQDDFSNARAIAQRWVMAMKPDDRTAIVTFGSEIVAKPFTADKEEL